MFVCKSFTLFPCFFRTTTSSTIFHITDWLRPREDEATSVEEGEERAWFVEILLPCVFSCGGDSSIM